MSGPYRPYPGNSGLPFNSQGNQPVSFKTDINRKKTKKWVAAKSVSYDGDDWGDEDDEEEEEVEAPPPLPTDTSRFYANAANHQLSSVGSQSGQAASPPVAAQPPISAPDTRKAESPSVQTPAFVRPADIYRRMQEEREKERQSEDSSRSGSVPPALVPASAPSPLASAQDTRELAAKPQGHPVEHSAAPLVIPELKRLSGFGQDFLEGTTLSDLTPQPAQPTQQQLQAQDSPLHHNPSLGFRSVVHQAFDVPETPTSSNDNFSRSNSDSTSVISPIISRGNVESDKTPTIAEDPAGEASAQEPPAGFKPGHRRDLSIPSPGNGPDRFPTVSTAEKSQAAEIVSPSHSGDKLTTSDDASVKSTHTSEQLASGEATPHPKSEPRESIESPNLHSVQAESQLGSEKAELQSREPTPLEIPQSQTRDIPQIAQPSMSTETSPQDMESDRLRKEIMRSLSPDTTAAGDPSANPDTSEFRQSQYRPGHESTYLPSEYDSYWNDQKAIPPTSPLQPKPTATPIATGPSSEPLSLTINPKSATEISSKEPDANSEVFEPHNTLKKRFSWEAADDSEEDVLEEQSERAPSVPPMQPPSTTEGPSASKTAQAASSAVFSNNIVRDTPLEDGGNALDEHGLPRYSTIANETVQRPVEPTSEVEEPTTGNNLASPEALASQSPTPIEPQVPNTSLQKQPLQPLGPEASLPSFRKIMEIPSPSEKVRVFNETREQFALIDNGLENWIRRSSESLPEHGDLIRLNGQLPGGAPTGVLPPKTKFPKLSSLGNLSLPSSHSHGDGSSSSGYSPGHARRPSGSHLTGMMNRQNVESKGKDLLHSAGVLGGKAGGAARGLFAKGKNKLRGGADKGKSSIFGGRRRSLQLTNDALVSDIDLANDQTQAPSSPLAPSRYSLQPVPRIPSFKFSGRPSFSDPFEADEDGPLAKPRAVSLDLVSQLRPVVEEEPSVSRRASGNSLRRAMMQFDIFDHDRVDNSEDLYSASSQPSGAEFTNSVAQNKGEEAKSLNGRMVSQSNGLPAASSGQHYASGTSNLLQRQSSATDAITGASLSAVSSLSNDINQMSSLDGSEFLSRQPPSLAPRETSVKSSEGTKHASLQLMASRSSLEMPIRSQKAPSNVPATGPSANDRDKKPARIHHVSRFYQSKAPSQTDNSIYPSDPNSDLEKTTSPDASVRSPVSPPLPETETEPTSYNGRRLSSASQVSDISKDEMDRIREKFDEDGLYTQLRDPSPSRSKVSALSNDDDDDDVDAALEEKLAEAGYNEDPEKDAPTQQAPRPQGPRRTSKPISVVRLSRFPPDRRVSQSAESTKRHSRFSFESDRNAIAEAMLVTGYGKPRLIDSSHEQNVSSQIPVTLGEEAPDEPPPPFDNPEAPYGADIKEAEENEATPPYDPRRESQSGPRRQSASTQQNPPQYQPIQSPLSNRESNREPNSEPNREPTWRKNRSTEPHAHRDSHASSVSHLSNTVMNSNAPRAAISPELQPSPPSNQVTFNSQKPKVKDSINAALYLGKSRWTDGRIAGGAHSRPLSGNNEAVAGNSSFFGPGRREEDSLGSGDSMAVQAALSRHDLRMEPSPLNQEGETASATSGNSFKVSVPLKNKIKFVGKRARGSSLDNPSVEANIESKTVDKTKKSDKKAEGKRGAFSKFTGIFNRSGQVQQVERRNRASQDSSLSLNSHHGSNTQAAYQTAYHASTVAAPHQYTHQYPSSYSNSHSQQQPATLPGHGKGLPPPPDGYYAPARSSPMEGYYGYQNQEYTHHPDTVGTYRSSREQAYPTQPQHPFYSPDQRNSGSSHSYSVGSPVSGTASTAWHTPSSPPLERGRSRAQDLRLRSRSPRAQPIRGRERFNDNVNYSDPIYNLGKFNAVTETPRIGDQSTPFPITLPEGLDKDQLSPRNSIQPEPLASSNPGLGLRQPGTTIQSVAAAASGSDAASNKPSLPSIPKPASSFDNSQPGVQQSPPTHTQTPDNIQYYGDQSVIAKNSVPVELPVPRDDESEEIVMSSTAYPGQEWQPSGYENWMMPP